MNGWRKCNFCDAELYIKTKQYAKPALAPLTVEQELRDRLVDLTGEVFLSLPTRYCPMCGRRKDNTK